VQREAKGPMIYILLPAFNEESGLPLLLKKIGECFEKNGNYLVVLVDDGSEDNSVEVARSFEKEIPIKIIQHGENKGLGAAINTGFEYLIPVVNDQDFIVTMDADNTHDPALIGGMVEKIEKNGLDVVVGSRYVAGADEIGVSVFRKLMSRGASLLIKMVNPIKGVKDYSSGYRLYRALALKSAWKYYEGRVVEESGFSCMVELLVKLANMSNLRFGEVPLVLRYDLKQGRSKMRIIRTIKRYLVLIIRSREWKKENKN